MKIGFFVILVFSVMLTVSVSDNFVFAYHNPSHHEENTSMKHNEKSTRHLPYKGVCAPGFTSLGEICVLNDRCGPGAYPGKVCTMDGKTQPYLKPLHQGHAGISADNVICAEGKHLMFKSHDSSPACVHEHSVDNLKNRGWQTELPNLACTLEYNPMCGVDGISYGNPCMLNTSHITLKHSGECSNTMNETTGIFDKILEYTIQPPIIDAEKGYSVTEIADGVYWLIGNGYQTMFLTTGEGVIVIDAPQPIGEKYIDAIKEVTDEPITHMIYSHHHQDHTSAAGQIFPADTQYISHKQTADVLIQENDPNRPIPTITFDDDMYTLSIGDKILELHFIGNYHSNGDLIITIPDGNIAMAVDLLRPGITPYRAFAVTPDMDQYLQTHDMLINDFDVLVSGHTGILTTKDHIKQNKQFALDVMDNVKEAVILVGSDNAVEKCVEITTEQWQGKLNNLDEFMTEHCQAMKNYLES
ncbi:MAG: MBL fold metallo-hydrolase [Nitrosopumilus sp.]|nr:MBL fold metallo-hydrolase [Nitrosopumilus sp.]MDH3488366.1 MBL fold metallo-hydrolase [Nitrosopumilus sp.]